MATKKKENAVPEIIDNVEALEAKMKAMREAQKKFATYTQEQVDKIFFEAAMAANKMRIPLAKMAVEETGRGLVEDKIIKNHYAAEYIYNKYKNDKTCGVIEEDKAYGIKKIAEPVGLVAAVIPTTNPTSTAIFKTLICLKTRNAIIISPHPAAKACTIAAAKVVLDAAVKAGAPEGIIGWIDVPSLELTTTVMRDSDEILATGGPGMVKSAYSSGKPALGVGPGNTPVIIDDSADIKMAVNSIIHSKTFDNGMICASEQSVTVLDSIYDEVKKEFAYRGCYFLKKGEELDKVRKTIIINGALNNKIPGKSAYEIAKLADVEVPKATKILIGEVESVDISEEFAHELDDVCRSYNMTVCVMDVNSNMKYVSINGGERLENRLIGYVFGLSIPFNDQRVIENGDDYVIQRTGQENKEYLEIYGRLNTGISFIMQTPLSSIQESARIANRFYMMIGCLGALAGGIIIWFVSRSVTKPILN